MKKRIGIIGAGISGVSLAAELKDKADVTVFEASSRPGGLIRCDQLKEGLYQLLGGHVFNTKSPVVAEWFWARFGASEFSRHSRNAKIFLNGTFVGYPIENHLNELPPEIARKIILDLCALIGRAGGVCVANVKEFLLTTFGQTLYDTYFQPYNTKIWQCDLGLIPVGWLEGKLPMPTPDEILTSNIVRGLGDSMVHAIFYYPKEGGSQYIINRLSAGVNIRCGEKVQRVERRTSGGWSINGSGEVYDAIVYTGDIRVLPTMTSVPVPNSEGMSRLRTRGITNVFCECDPNDISWVYLPERRFAANRIINTGALSRSNSRGPRSTCVVEFAYGESEERITADIRHLPFNLSRVAQNHVRDAYIIHEQNTHAIVAEAKQSLAEQDLHLLGRFAEWEYYNMDKCIESALNLARTLLN
jgi:protoporphyrinogen oxidase